MTAIHPSGMVASALARGGAVVALETSVIAQGLPPPRNRECVERMTAAIREAGAVPAWVGVAGGEVRIGLSRDELEAFAEPGAALKVARRDLPFALASGGLGATTVSTTIWAAARVGIGVAWNSGLISPRSSCCSIHTPPRIITTHRNMR